MPKKTFFYLSLAVFTLFSCSTSSEEESDENSDSIYSIQDVNENMLILDETAYASDWLILRDAISEKDTATIRPFISSDIIDMNTLINSCSEEWVLSELKELRYEELAEIDQGGELIKEFRVETAIFEDGETYDYGLILRFKETPSGLKLSEFLVAG